MDIQNLCDSIDNTKRLVLINNCFSVKMNQTILAELCCLSRLAMPMEGFERVSSPVAPHATLTIFDNGLDVSPLSDKMQVRGIVMCFGYPSLDAEGDTLLDEAKNVLIHLYDKDNNHFALPACKAFIHLCNPVGNNRAMVLNRVVVENVGNFTLNVEALLTSVNKEGMVLTQGQGSCC